MKQHLLSDEMLTLRAPEMSDLDMLFLWENDSSLWHVGNAIAPYSRKQLWEYIETYVADIFATRQLRFIIQENNSEKPIGTIDLFDFDPINRHASLGIYIQEDYRQKGYAKRAIEILCKYCSVHIGMHTLTAITSVNNNAGMKLFKSCGFSTSGCLRSWIRRSSTYEDAIVLQLLFNI